MLQNTERDTASVHTSAARPSVIHDLTEELVAQGVRPRLLDCDGGQTAGGIAMRVPVQKALQCGLPKEHLMRGITALLHEGVPLTLSLCELGPEQEATGSLEDFCHILRQALDTEGLAAEQIGMSMQSHLVPLQAYLLISTAILGRGPRYVILDSLQMRHHDDKLVRQEADSNWAFLWRRRDVFPTILPAYAASVTTRCPLLGDEAAAAILPEPGLQVPPATAWLPLQVDLGDFSDGDGRLRWHDLEQALELAVVSGDRLFDHLYWPLPQQRSDAWQNRRLAISISGVGDLVVERRADPADLRCLQWIDKVLGRIHSLLWNCSRELAQKSAPLPALSAGCPAVRWDCDVKKSNWDLEWRRAVASSAVRHRNLMVMSPYAVLPTRAGGSTRFFDLLPVLHHADAFSFAGPQVSGIASCGEFRSFHRRAWAVMQRRNAASLVAAGV